MTAKLQLPGVTLLTVTGVDIDQAHAALQHCAGQAEFGAVKMLSPTRPSIADSRVTYEQIPAIDFVGYSRFIIEALNAHVQTEHCLIVQSDGFILNPARWDDRFLGHDYIGAPWPASVPLMPPGSGFMRLDRNSVGNGGFSLRSKKLLEITSRIRFDELNFPLKSEDLVICHYLYDEMRAAGVCFAPPELAALFSIESVGIYGQSVNSVFGFHGKHWLDAWRAASRPAQGYYNVTINTAGYAQSWRPPPGAKS